MLKLANTFADRFAPKFGLPTLPVNPGETFDANNDLTLGDDGWTVFHRDGHVSYGGPADAILTYNKRHMSGDALREYLGEDDPTECGFGNY